MEGLQDLPVYLDSPSKHSYFGSYYAPPDRMGNERQEKSGTKLRKPSRVTPHTAPDTGGKAVIAALKSLQEKMRRLELERLEAERNVERFAQTARQSRNQTNQELHSRDKESSKRRELVSQLHSAEARCSLLEKQVEYMRKLVESAQKEKASLGDRGIEDKKKPTEPQIQAQLQKLEEECVKLTNTQSEAERKIKLLEQKLLEEEHERKLVQEKAAELQRELEANLLCSAAEVKPKKKISDNLRKKALTPEVRWCAKAQRMPFVAGTSTSPSYSVNANVQSLLHLLKTRQPRLCEKKHSQRASQPQSNSATAALGSLSELLLALQDELGHMSFEHQELVRQIDETERRELREDLERELDCLVKRMEGKAAQITKLRKHQQTVKKLSQCSPRPKARRSSSADRVQSAPTAISKSTTSRPQERLQVLRDAQKMQSSLRQRDISWEA